MAEFKSLQETAYNYIRNKVLTGQLQPGVLYSETKAAAEINISRTPMKYALVRLSQDQLIDIIPSKGFRLHRMSIEDVLHTYQARTAVEGFCAMQLAQRRSEPDGREALRVMRECLTDMELFLKQEPLEDFLPPFWSTTCAFTRPWWIFPGMRSCCSCFGPITTACTSLRWRRCG